MAGLQKRDGIIFVGLNLSAAHEAEDLRRAGNQVLFAGGRRKAGQVMVGGRGYDPRTSAGREALFARFRLGRDRARALEAAVGEDGWSTHSVVAQLALILARADLGSRAPDRMVISGHHSGNDFFWGTGLGMLTIGDFQALAKVFSRAAGAIEDLHLSACHSAANLKRWTNVFPNLATVWAYSGSAPGTYSGASLHLRIWDKATRGHQLVLDRGRAGATRKGDAVTTWSRVHGYSSGTVEPLSVLRDRIAEAEGVYMAFFRGDRAVADMESGPLREYYNDLQAVLRHPDLPARERPALEKRRDVTVRLLHYEGIKRRFAEAYRSEIAAGYSALKMPPPDFSRMTRKEALAAVSEFVSKAGNNPTAPVALLRRILEGLRDLNDAHIPITWV